MWIFDNKEFRTEDIQDYVGFVYIITNISNNKQYIGKKLFYFKKYKIIKGKKKRIFIESDWKNYYSSSEILKNEVKEFGGDNFNRKILKLCKTKSEMSYWECYYQMLYHVLYDKDRWYNEWISVRIRRSHLIKDKK